VKHGDFSTLASDYSRYRPGYSASVLSAALGLLDVPPAEVDAADIGAGTGIFSRLLGGRGLRSVTAIEPNDDMRQQGVQDSDGTGITWRDSSGEQTGLPSASLHLVTTASSFHWMDFERTTIEFHRVLRPGGRLLALWNPRLIETNPLLVDIEAELRRLVPDLKRVSSGKSEFTATLTENLLASDHFDDVLYLEGRHSRRFTPEAYLGVWRSVNDVQVQAGPERFAAFLSFIEDRIAGRDVVADYRTVAWCARASR